MSKLRYRIDTYDDGNVSLIQDTPEASLNVYTDRPDMGTHKVVSSALVEVTDERVDKQGRIRSKLWDDLKEKAHTHHIKVDEHGSVLLTAPAPTPTSIDMLAPPPPPSR